MAATSLLAATLTIAFEGLMLFQGPSATQKTHVAIVDAPHHDPFVQIINGDEIKLKKGYTVTFDTGPGTADTDQFFDKYVITLKDHLFFGNIDREVVANDVDHDGTLATVTLPDGELTTLWSFKDAVTLDTWITFASTHCFPRYVVLTTTGDVKKMTITDAAGNAKDYDVDDAIVVVSNGGTHGSPDTHFQYYRRLTASLALLEKASFVKDGCDPYEPQPPLDEAVLEALKDRINRIPNGDCGPVDNP